MKDAIAILTGGGPAPGMNTVVGSVAKTFLNKGYRVVGLHAGYSGLFSKMPARSISTSCWLTISSIAVVRTSR